MTELRGRRCLDCAALLDDETVLTGPVPSDGDVSICLYCGCIAFYAANTERLRRPTAAEETQLAGDPRVLLAVHAAAAVRASMTVDDR